MPVAKAAGIFLALKHQPTPASENSCSPAERSTEKSRSEDESANLRTWSSAGWILRSATPGTAGAVTEVWRLTGPAAAGDRVYVQCRTTHH